MRFAISAAASRGGRKYMEDRMIIKPLRSKGRLDGLFVAILDGHGGSEASDYVRENLLPTMLVMDGFHSENDDEVLNCMRDAFLKVHDAMRTASAEWPSNAKGYPSTAGTTCSCALIRNNKIYTAHCGDSRIVLLKNSPGPGKKFISEDLTHDHKPDDPTETLRIHEAGGAVSHFTAVSRVIWTRETMTNPKRIESVPFLSIARSLGDYWSYVPKTGQYAVSPMPDVDVRPITEDDKYLVLVSDGITNVMSSSLIARHISFTDPSSSQEHIVKNPATNLLAETLDLWKSVRPDNSSILCVQFLNEEDHNLLARLPSDSSGPNIYLYLTIFPKKMIVLDQEDCRGIEPVKDNIVIYVLPNFNTIDLDNYFDYSGPGYNDECFISEDDVEFKVSQNDTTVIVKRNVEQNGKSGFVFVEKRPISATFNKYLSADVEEIVREKNGIIKKSLSSKLEIKNDTEVHETTESFEYYHQNESHIEDLSTCDSNLFSAENEPSLVTDGSKSSIATRLLSRKRRSVEDLEDSVEAKRFTVH